MGKIRLLDCTLRDGGYRIDWEFGKNVIANIFEGLVSARVDIIEIGFLDDSRKFDENRTIMPNTQSLNKIFGKLRTGNSMVVAMIDYGTCDICNIQPCSETCIDGIRVIFKEEKMVQALEYCGKLKKLGYKVFVQLVSVTTYTDDKLLELCKIANEVEPYAVSIVDTYGLLYMSGLLHIADVLHSNLKENIVLGYHGHNNFQMGYANGITFIEKRLQRDILIDGTLYGMGKSAGNTPIELLAMYLNETRKAAYDIGRILETIESDIMGFYKKVEWGYSLPYFAAALTKCHPDYVSYLMDKEILSMKAMIELMGSICDEKKLSYNETYIENKYLEYQNMKFSNKEGGRS